jgi:hypothetical protein
MSGFFHHVAVAALPVAVVLLTLAVAARGVLWIPVDDPRAQRLAREYLGAVCTWCLTAAAVTVFARLAAGDTGVLGLAMPIGIGTAAAMLGVENPVTHPAPAPAAPVAPPARDPDPPAPERAPAAPLHPTEGSLWAHRLREDGAPRSGLWDG